MTNENRGLSCEEAQKRLYAGYGNVQVKNQSKSVGQIIAGNIFTYFNFIFAVFTALLVFVRSYVNMTFLPIIVCNTMIGIVQEIRAKRVLDRLTLMNEPKTQVVRSGQMLQVDSEQLVLGDLCVFQAGNQICADAVVEKGSLRVNEALITGEADEVVKNPGDILYSGSFVVSGKGYATLTKVGLSSFAAQLMLEAKASRKNTQTEMMRSLDRLVRIIGIAIIPIGILLFLQQHFVIGSTIQESVVSMIASLVGMIPEGLYLLASIALVVSVMRLGRKKVLVHEMACVETLARVNVLCVDKTGTITENKMSVREIIPLAKEEEETSLHALIGDVVANLDADNITMQALKDYFDGKSERKAQKVIPFSSQRKYSGVRFEEGLYLIGAPERLLAERYGKYDVQISDKIDKGVRVLVFGRYGEEQHLFEPLAFILVSNPIRRDARETFEYFQKEDVCIKVISGDHPKAAAAVAKKAGIAEADRYIDVSQLSDEELEKAAPIYTVFGRVSPEQKKKLLLALKKAGNVVAMTGDGVNDAPALKQADVGVAMGITGTEVAKDAAAMILTDDNFATIVKAVKNGRNIYENIKKAILFLLSGNLAGIITVLFCSLSGLPVPFAPIHLLFINLLTDSLPAIALGLEPHSEDVMKCKPRPAGESILTKDFLIKTGYSGVIISLATISAFLLGYFYQGAHNAGAAMTMAFATLCMARLFHGFSCKADKPVLFSKRLWNNKFTILAFLAGMLLINAVLWIPALHNLFQIENGMSGLLIGAIYGFSFGSMLLVQLVKAIVCAVRKSK